MFKYYYWSWFYRLYLDNWTCSLYWCCYCNNLANAFYNLLQVFYLNKIWKTMILPKILDEIFVLFQQRCSLALSCFIFFQCGLVPAVNLLHSWKLYLYSGKQQFPHAWNRSNIRIEKVLIGISKRKKLWFEKVLNLTL